MFDRFLNGLLAVAVLLLCALGIWRHWSLSRDAALTIAEAGPPTIIAEWSQVLAAGLEHGSPEARVKVATFEDLECGFCRQFHESTLPSLHKRFGESLSHVFVHFPLERHRFARLAAQAVECAALAGRGYDYIGQAYKKQDSLGLLPWSTLAYRAGVPDTSAFSTCLHEDEVLPRIEAGRAIGEAIGVSGTPTVIVNGLRFLVPPTERELVRVIDSMLAGR